MKNFKMPRQGELLFSRVESFDDGGNFERVEPESGHLIIGHSETGHHHVIDVVKYKSAELLIDQTNELIARLELGEDVEVEHLKSFDTHASVPLKKGKYIVRHRREYTPEGLRRVQD